MSIYVVNLSSVVDDNSGNLMVSASNILLPRLASDWNIIAPIIVYKGKNPGNIPAGVWLMYLIDSDASVPDALAYHTEENDQVVGYVLCKTILDNGGVVLYKDNVTPTVSSALFHEIAESLIDDDVNQWWDSFTGLLYAAEVADPVQGNIVPININGTMVGLSDYILPAWKDTESQYAKYNYLNTLKNPFEIDSGGYAIVMSEGFVFPIWGNTVPQWIKDQKMKSRRLKSRGKDKLKEGKPEPKKE